MPAAKIICPECNTVLKPTKPVPDGRRVKCPKCGEPFTTPGLGAGDDEDEAPRKAAITKSRPEPAAAGKKKAAPKRKPEPAPAPPPKPSAGDDDEGGGGIYTFAKEDEPADEDKPEINYAPDMSIKDLRGPAQLKVTRPSNGLLVAGALGVIFGLLSLAYYTWPFMFSEYMLDHEKFLEVYYKSSGDKKVQEKAKSIPRDRKDVSKEDLIVLEEAEDELRILYIWLAVASIIPILYSGVLVVAAVKMQNLESYGWSMTAAIMGIIPLSFWLLSVPMGIWALITLKDEEVIAGFNYVPE